MYTYKLKLPGILTLDLYHMTKTNLYLALDHKLMVFKLMHTIVM